MERIDTLESLLLHELKDLYHAEKQLVKALPAWIGTKIRALLTSAPSIFERALTEARKTGLQRRAAV